jgi:predicted PurR-regulated permease PerM
MMLAGIVGLFVGAVTLTLGWEILQYWLREVDAPVNETLRPEQEAVESSDQG